MTNDPSEEPRGRAWRFIAHVAVLALLAVGAGVLRAIDPSEASFLPRCMVHECTCLYCPGCGSTRAVHALLNGDPADAFRKNPLIVLTAPFLLYWGVSLAAEHMLGVRLPRVRIRPVWAWSIVVVVIAFAVLRNIPAHPFSLLAPH